MSADNGIYILKLKDQCRVGEFQAIENLNWSFVEMKILWNEISPVRIIEHYGSLKPLSYAEAKKEAFKLAKDNLILEYGIQTIKVNKKWEEILSEAKSLIKVEIASLKTTQSSKWDYELNNLIKLEKLLNE